MKLDDAQMARVREWIDQGMKVAEVQTRLADEFGVRLTYMEARFLLDDLKLRPKDPPPAPKAANAPAGTTAGALGGTAGPGLGAGPSGAGRPGSPGLAGPSGAPLRTSPLAGELPGEVSVAVDQIARPGALVSGKVTFSDGQSADWQLDQYGRLGLAPRTPGYKPSQSDLASFQAELEGSLAKLGY